MMAESNLTLLGQDKLARERIEKDIETNFFVEAGAGSGKTTALVRRMAALVRSGVNVEEICAITFTRAAANEFRDRFRRKLSEYSRDPELTEEERSRCADALHNIDLCFTGTIDSFCGKILSEHPLEAGVLPGASVSPNSELRKLYLAEYRRAAKGEHGEELQKKYYRFCDVHDNPYDVFDGCIESFMNTRNSELCYRHPDDVLFDENSESKKSFVEMIVYISEHSEIWKKSRSESKTQAQLDAAARIKENIALLQGSWVDRLRDVLNLFKYSVQPGKNSSYEFDIELVSDPGELFLSKYSDFLVPHITEKKQQLTSYTVDLKSSRCPLTGLKELKHSITLDFLNHFVRKAAGAFRKTGSLSYFDCLLYLRDMLKKDAQTGGELIRHIQGRHSYYLIDEFQDTNPMQAEVFFYLTAKEPQADWRSCIPRPGSLFIVGDPKQSVYRFRNADVASYLRVRDMFCGEIGECLALTRNFRSTRELCGWFNGAFSQLMNNSSGTQSRFDRIPTDESDPETMGSLHGVYRYDCGQLSDHDYLAAMIEWLVNSEEHTVRGKEKGTVRPLRYGDIMVITPNSTNLGRYIKAFKNRGIPAFVEGMTLFDSCCVLKEASRVLSAIAFPADTIKVYEALRGRGFAVDDEAVHRWRAINRRFTLNSSSDDERFVYEPVNSALMELNKIARDTRHMTVSAALTTIIDRLRLYEKCGSDALEYLHYALELLRSAELTGSAASLQDGAQFINDLLGGKQDGSKIDRCLSLSREENRVHIANAHKVKGLEAPVVILADPSAWNPSAEMSIDHSGDVPVCRRFVLKTLKKEFTRTADFAEEKEAELNANAEEKIRLRYVSATRAEDMLIIADKKKGEVSDDTSFWYRLLALDPSMPVLDVAVLPQAQESGEPVVGVSAESIYAAAEKESIFADRAAEEKTYTILRPSQEKLSGRKASNDEPREQADKALEEKVRSELSRRNAAVIGSMAHRLMENLVLSKGRTDTGMLVQAIRQEFYDLIAGYDCELTEILSDIAAKITSGGYPQTNGVPDDILSELASADTVMCEVPFCLRSEKDGTAAIISGVMDLVYRKDGKWHIIDYKTSKAAQYAAQLESYREAFHALTGEQADAKVYHIDA